MLKWKKMPHFLAYIAGVLVFGDGLRAVVRGKPFDVLGLLLAFVTLSGIAVITMAALTATDWIVSHVEPDLRDGIRLVVAIPLVALVWVGCFLLLVKIGP